MRDMYENMEVNRAALRVLYPDYKLEYIHLLVVSQQDHGYGYVTNTLLRQPCWLSVSHYYMTILRDDFDTSKDIPYPYVKHLYLRSDVSLIQNGTEMEDDVLYRTDHAMQSITRYDGVWCVPCHPRVITFEDDEDRTLPVPDNVWVHLTEINKVEHTDIYFETTVHCEYTVCYVLPGMVDRVAVARCLYDDLMETYVMNVDHDVMDWLTCNGWLRGW